MRIVLRPAGPGPSAVTVPPRSPARSQPDRCGSVAAMPLRRLRRSSGAACSSLRRVLGRWSDRRVGSTTTAGRVVDGRARGALGLARAATTASAPRSPCPLDDAHPHGEQIDLALRPGPGQGARAAHRIAARQPRRAGRAGRDFVKDVAEHAAGGDHRPLRRRRLGPPWHGQAARRSTAASSSTTSSTSTPHPTTPPSGRAGRRVAASSRSACEQGSGDLLRTSRRSTPSTTWSASAPRSATTSSPTRGFSYGTYLGALYAQEYPDKVRALVLDGAVDPAIPVAEVSLQQAKGFEASLDAFLQDCARRDESRVPRRRRPGRALARCAARIDRDGDQERRRAEARAHGARHRARGPALPGRRAATRRSPAH